MDNNKELLVMLQKIATQLEIQNRIQLYSMFGSYNNVNINHCKGLRNIAENWLHMNDLDTLVHEEKPNKYG